MVSELTDGAFQEIIDDPAFASGDLDAGRVKRVILCSGKVYYDLARRREETGRDDVAIVRLEQLYPLHTERLEAIVSAYPTKAEKVWVQEEPRNMGAFLFLNEQVTTLLGWNPLPYIGREPSATPATGSKKQHAKEQEALLTDAVGPAPGAGAKPESKQKQKVGAP